LFNMRCSGQQEGFCTGPKIGRRDIKCRIPIRDQRHTQPGNHLNGGTWHQRPISCSDLLIRCTKLSHDVIGVPTCVTNNMILLNRIRLTFFTNHACPDDPTFQCLRLSNRYLRRAQDPDSRGGRLLRGPIPSCSAGNLDPIGARSGLDVQVAQP
jgi:hypothetical protein